MRSTMVNHFAGKDEHWIPALGVFGFLLQFVLNFKIMASCNGNFEDSKPQWPHPDWWPSATILAMKYRIIYAHMFLYLYIPYEYNYIPYVHSIFYYTYIYMRVVLNSFTRKRTSSPNKKFSFAKLSPYPCLTLAVHGQMSHRNFSVVAAHSDSMFLHSILVLAHLHRLVLTLPRPNCSTHLLQRSLSKPSV